MRKALFIGALIVSAMTLGVALALTSSSEGSPRTDVDSVSLETPRGTPLVFSDGDGGVAPLAEARPRDRGESRRGRRGDGEGDFRRFGRADESPEAREARRERRQARREERQRAWQSMTPEEREARLADRFQIESLGEEESTLSRTEVAEAMRTLRPQIRQCVQEQGGFRALRERRAAAPVVSDAGVGRGRRPRGFSVSLDVREDGSVDPESIFMEPSPPAELEQCFTNAYASLTLPPPGPGGAAVDIRPFGRRR